MGKFNYWMNRAKAVFVCDEKTARAYQYLIAKALECSVFNRGVSQ